MISARRFGCLSSLVEYASGSEAQKATPAARYAPLWIFT